MSGVPHIREAEPTDNRCGRSDELLRHDDVTSAPLPVDACRKKTWQ